MNSMGNPILLLLSRWQGMQAVWCFFKMIDLLVDIQNVFSTDKLIYRKNYLYKM